jgi:hypothetical protein
MSRALLLLLLLLGKTLSGEVWDIRTRAHEH